MSDSGVYPRGYKLFCLEVADIFIPSFFALMISTNALKARNGDLKTMLSRRCFERIYL